MANSSVDLIIRIVEQVAPDDVDLAEATFEAAIKGGNDWLSLHRSGSKPLHGAVLPLGEPSLLVPIIDFFKDYGPTIKEVLASAASISTLVRNLRSTDKKEGNKAPEQKPKADKAGEHTAENLHENLTSALVQAGLKRDAAETKSLCILQELNKDPKASETMVDELERKSDETK